MLLRFQLRELLRSVFRKQSLVCYQVDFALIVALLRGVNKCFVPINSGDVSDGDLDAFVSLAFAGDLRDVLRAARVFVVSA